MGDKSKIEWTDATWNPATGCTKVSPGCAHCYIERSPPFRTKHRQFDAKNSSTDVQLHPERLAIPLHWKRPRQIFVNSLSDLFHESIPFEFVDRVFAVMALCPQHAFQILTKRPERMYEYLSRDRAWDGPVNASFDMERAGIIKPFVRDGSGAWWPLKNVWLGVTCENQHFADERIPLLLQTPAAVRFISAEPLLGPVDLARYLPNGPFDFKCPLNTLTGDNPGGDEVPGLDWVICGGESGPKARPMDLAWARETRDQCRAAGVPFFMKQICRNGRPIPFEEWPKDLRVREQGGRKA